VWNFGVKAPRTTILYPKKRQLKQLPFFVCQRSLPVNFKKMIVLLSNVKVNEQSCEAMFICGVEPNHWFNPTCGTMNNLINQLSLRLDERLYQKDPTTSELGMQILHASIGLLHLHGLEQFTFKKLAQHIHSTESSIYRYFQNKHQLTSYLTSWYWAVLEVKLAFATANVTDPEVCLMRAMETLADPEEYGNQTPGMNLKNLQKVVAQESFKTLHIHYLHEGQREGFFASYNQICDRLAGIFTNINPSYPYPKTLSMTVLEAALNQQFLQTHMPDGSEASKQPELLSAFLYQLVKGSLSSETSRTQQDN
jgi:AcrR family transcriptional regulator